MHLFRKYYILGFVIILGCAEPEIIIPPFEIPTTGRNVLIEELTGVRCPNCPSAAARLESIKLLYGENIVLVTIHGDLLTRPLPESKYDFRNEDASALEENFKPFIGKPSVIINRKIHPQFELMANPLQDQWQTIVENELQVEQSLSIIASIEKTDEYYDLSIGTIPLVPLAGNHFLHIFIVENNLIDAQEDVNRIIPDYEHDHVLRKIISPIDGLAMEPLTQIGEIVNNKISILSSDLNSEWILENVELIIFITNDQNEVLQAISTELLD